MSNLIRWSPSRDIMSMQNAIDRLFDASWPSSGLWNMINSSNVLALDLHETDGVYQVIVNLPGIDPDAIDVTVTDNILSISAELSQETRDESTQTLVQERAYGKFSRQLTLPMGVDADNVETHFENGVLTLTLPKNEANKRRRIPIRMPKLINN